tara:strand:+ start:873 stop:1109 length:237 start_codon:yes stop_codon:yes gene_type:complete
MTDKTELEIKQQAVVDAKATYAIAAIYAVEAAEYAIAAIYAADAAAAADHAAIAYDAWTKARLELSDCLKEHGDEHSI